MCKQRHWSWITRGLFCGLCAFSAGNTTRAADDFSRLSVQASPFPCATLRTPEGKILFAVPYSSLATAVPAGEKMKMADVDVTVVYAIPENATQGAVQITLQNLARRCLSKEVFLVSTVLTRHEMPVRWIHTRPPAHWLVRDRKISLRGVGGLSVTILPSRVEDSHVTLALLHLDAAHISVGVVYQVTKQKASMWPEEHDVVILQLSKLPAVMGTKALSVLDPGIAVLVDDEARSGRSSLIGEFSEQLHEMWIDVYTVQKRQPFVITAGPHGIFLPLKGTHA